MPVIRIETESFVRTIVMDRPEALNAFNADMVHELCEAFLAAALDPTVRVAVLTGAGRAFSAGADLKAMGSPRDPSKRGLEELMGSILDFPKPLIVAANGVGAGIGMTLCGVADLTLMAESARFRAPFSALGVTAEAASTYTFSRLMGHQAAAWVLLSSEWFSAKQCVEMGLALELVPDDQILARAHERARTLAKLPLLSLTTTKRLLMAPHLEAMKRAVAAECRELAALAGGPASREAVAAFREKRDPDFSQL